jgi:hypothetical protein
VLGPERLTGAGVEHQDCRVVAVLRVRERVRVVVVADTKSWPM